jgi:hypothetical protein
VRDRGRAGGDPRLAYLEWCDDLPGECQAGKHCDHAITTAGCRMDDEARWHRANTQLGRRISLEYVRAERRAMPPEEFGRERMGWWDDSGDVADCPININAFLACEDDESQAVGLLTFAVTVTYDRSMATITAAGARPDGKVHVEIVDRQAGTGWVVDRLVELRAKWRPAAIMLDKSGPAASLLPTLGKAGLTIVAVTAAEMAQACGGLQDAVEKDDRIRHLGQAEMVSAASGARSKPVGDSWVFARKASIGDVTPMEGVALAVYGHVLYGNASVGVFHFADLEKVTTLEELEELEGEERDQAERDLLDVLKRSREGDPESDALVSEWDEPLSEFIHDIEEV